MFCCLFLYDHSIVPVRNEKIEINAFDTDKTNKANTFLRLHRHSGYGDGDRRLRFLSLLASLSFFLSFRSSLSFPPSSLPRFPSRSCSLPFLFSLSSSLANRRSFSFFSFAAARSSSRSLQFQLNTQQRHALVQEPPGGIYLRQLCIRRNSCFNEVSYISYNTLPRNEFCPAG